MKRCSILFVGLFCCIALQAQTFEEQYNEFKNTAKKEYDDFRLAVNKEYAEFMRQAWEYYKVVPAIPKPKEEEVVPPVIYSQGDEKENPIVLPYEEIVVPPKPEEQPKPVVPIKEDEESDDYFMFQFLGTDGKVRIDNKVSFKIQVCNEEALADTWDNLSRQPLNNLIRDCLELRIKHRLCDWAYLKMLQNLSGSFLGKGTNEALFLQAYLFSQSGYKMRLAYSQSGKLFLLITSKHQIYDMSYYEIEGEYYYPLNCQEDGLYICAASYPKEQSLSLVVHEDMVLAMKETKERELKAEGCPMQVKVSVNRNLIDFYNDYPTSMIDNDFGTRWAMYANTPINVKSRVDLYTQLKEQIHGKSEWIAVNMLLNFVQTAFVYEYDDKVWGEDRAFFAEETLFYPYCDCEDRSILFSRLVRDLLGLKVVLLYYPGHLATAVHFTSEVKGDHLLIKNNKYVVCDPTYINAPVGVTMPEVDNQKAKVIQLE